MIKYFIRHYWRYLAMALAFATISFFLKSCNVNALERIQSIPLGYTATLPLGSNSSATIYNSSSNNFSNWGRGYLTFSLAEYWTSVNTSTNLTTIREINVTSSGNIYTCNFGSVAMDYNYEDNVKVVSYSVICDVVMGSNGLQQITVNHSNGLSNSIVVKTSDYMTFSDNLDIDISSVINTASTQIQNYLNTIALNQATYTQSINTTITNVVNTNFTTLTTLLTTKLDTIITGLTGIRNGQRESVNAINDNTDAINDTNDTIKDSTVDDPDDDLEDMQENEISNSVISDLLLLPIDMFENIIDAIGGSCSSFPLGELFGTSLLLPCINIPSLIGSNLWNVIDILFCGIFVLSIRKKFVDIFENITSLKDRGNELE